MNIKKCAVENCDNTTRRQGEKSIYCHMHYKRFRESGDAGSFEAKRVRSYNGAKCSINNCDNIAEKKTFCTYHYDSARNTTLSVEEVAKLKSEGCAVCGSKERLTLDHDHSCCGNRKSCEKCVRGILCHKCNTALGLLDDNFDRIIDLATYLIAKRNFLTNV